MAKEITQEPGDIVEIILSKLISFRLNYKESNYRECVTLIYSAFEGIVRYILAVKGYYPQSHEGIHTLLALHFIKNGAISKKVYNYLTNLYLRRKDADYRGFIVYDKSDVDEYLQWILQSFNEVSKFFHENDKKRISNEIGIISEITESQKKTSVNGTLEEQ